MREALVASQVDRGFRISHRQLFLNAAIAASRVGS
jgi:hypothetical protein